MAWLITPKRLKERGIVGMNARNGLYVAEYNPRQRYPLVDDKVQTKRLAQQAGLPVPALYGMIKTHHDIRNLSTLLDGHSSFVVKPARGSGGEGIIVINDRVDEALFRRASGRTLSLDALEHHISNILSGAYSLGGLPDVAMLEKRVEFTDLFRDISYQGVPDIRIIVYRGYPAMAMIRLPTQQSDGKANLHQGAIGAGIDLASGRTTAGVWENQAVKVHPDTGFTIVGHEIPGWSELLTLAAGCFELVGLGYLGVDIVLDRNQGPLILELNARPGLAIQIANRQGLKPRLDCIDVCVNDNPQASAYARSHWFEHYPEVLRGVVSR